jgi:hypothetical protein
VGEKFANGSSEAERSVREGLLNPEVTEGSLECCEASDHLALQSKGRHSVGNALLGFRNKIQDDLAQLANSRALGLVERLQLGVNLFLRRDPTI